MPRYVYLRRMPATHLLRMLHLATILLPVVLLAACALPGATAAVSTHPRSTATPQSRLAGQTVYWSQGSDLVALRASDGQVRWQVEGAATPTLADGTLYASVGLNPAGAEALTANGTARWRAPLSGCFNAVGSGEPPLLSDGLLFVAVSGHDCAPSGWVYALRASDGTMAWRAPFEPMVLPTQALTDNALFVASSTYPAANEQDFLTALRPADGTRLWRVRLDVSPYYLATANGVVLISGYASGDTFEARRASDGQLLWKTPADRYNLAPPVNANGFVYVSGHDGTLDALRLADGTQQWSVTTSAGSGMLAPAAPAVAESGTMYWGAGPLLYALDASTGAVRQTYHLFRDKEGSAPGTFDFVYSPPTFANGALFVAAYAHPIICCSAAVGATLNALDASTGAELWQYDEPTGSATLPAVVGPAVTG